MDGPRNIVVSYILWFFLGMLGAHRMYNRRIRSGIVMAGCFLLTLRIPLLALLVGIWWAVDAFLIFRWDGELD